jgi:hypothetical protein
MCCGGLPGATAALWHLAQFATIPAWFMWAPANVLVLLWQVSHGEVVAMCCGGLPEAAVPLWHLAQFATVPAWFMRPVIAAAPGVVAGAVDLVEDVVLVPVAPAATAPGANIAPFHVLVLK